MSWSVILSERISKHDLQQRYTAYLRATTNYLTEHDLANVLEDSIFERINQIEPDELEDEEDE
jgi:hypothetical protein